MHDTKTNNNIVQPAIQHRLHPDDAVKRECFTLKNFAQILKELLDLLEHRSKKA